MAPHLSILSIYTIKSKTIKNLLPSSCSMKCISHIIIYIAGTFMRANWKLVHANIADTYLSPELKICIWFLSIHSNIWEYTGMAMVGGIIFWSRVLASIGGIYKSLFSFSLLCIFGLSIWSVLSWWKACRFWQLESTWFMCNISTIQCATCK